MASAARILLTGRPGVGKTTIIKKVLEVGIPVAGGFLTEEIRRGGRRIGFAVKDIHSGRDGILARVDLKDGPRVGQYRVNLASFESVGVEALRQALAGEGCVVIDEIGKMELCSAAFRAAVSEVFESGRSVMASIAIHDHPFLSRMRQVRGVTLVEAVVENRNDLPARIAGMLAGESQPQDAATR